MKPQVKESEKSRVLMSKDYSMFDFPDFKVSKKHLEKMKDSIRIKNLSKDYPILVSDNDYKIIEGRYRFLACYELQLPVYYKVAEVTTHKDAIRIKHIHKNIHLEDVISIYSELPQYGNILKLHSLFSDSFTITFICYAIKEARQMNKAKDTELTFRHFPKLNRLAIDGGTLAEWDFKEVRARLIRIKDFVNKYGSYGWTEKEGMYFMDEKPKVFSNAEDLALKKSVPFREEINLYFKMHGGWDKEKQCYRTSPNGDDITYINLYGRHGETFWIHNHILWSYNYLLYVAKQGNYPGMTHQVKECLKKVGLN